MLLDEAACSGISGTIPDPVERSHGFPSVTSNYLNAYDECVSATG